MDSKVYRTIYKVQGGKSLFYNIIYKEDLYLYFMRYKVNDDLYLYFMRSKVDDDLYLYFMRSKV